MPARPYAIQVIKRLCDAGYIAYFAGGWVRDFLMKKASDDIDIATNASVEEIIRLFPKTVPVGIAFGIVIVVEGPFHFEVATFRRDRDYVDGRRPIGFDPANPKEDAKRRDFTINGMFYDPLKEQLLDFVGGQEDIAKKVIRAIGNPHARFAEDRLRMMRAIRYATRFDFTIEKKTLDAILAHAQDLLPAVAIERVWQEFKKMSHFAHFDQGLISLHSLKLLPVIFPSLQSVPLSEIKKRVSTIERFPKNTPAIAEILELFPEYTLAEILELCEYLKVSKHERDVATFLHKIKTLFQMPASWIKNLELYEWAKIYAHPTSSLALEIVAAHHPKQEQIDFLNLHTERRKILAKPVERLEKKEPLVKAEDLMKQGVKPGKKMGELLLLAERISTNQLLEDKEAVISQLPCIPK